MAQFIAVTLVLSCHEFAHAFVAFKHGDSTAKIAGRMTLNPFKHFDPIGLVVFVLTGFGWAKPVPINPYNFKEYQKGCFWTSAAGIITNYAMAFLAYPLYVIALHFLGAVSIENTATYPILFLLRFLYATFACSLSFSVFNLLPVYPLDGFRIVDAVHKKRGKIYYFLRNYGYYLLLGLIFLGFFADRIPNFNFDVFGYIMHYLVAFFGKPITLLWDFIFGFII